MATKIRTETEITQIILHNKHKINKLVRESQELNRNSERIPRSLSEQSGDPAFGAAGLASESNKDQLPYGGRFPAACCRVLFNCQREVQVNRGVFQ